MPITAKLSRKFYETFGEQIANELVEWFNAVDATYKADLRELNDYNFQRFDERLARRLAEFGGNVDARIAELRTEIARQGFEFRAEFQRGLATSKASVIRWMFVFWIGTLAPLAGLVILLTG